MQFRLDHIGPEGLDVDEPIGLDWLAGVFEVDFFTLFEPLAATRASGRLRRIGLDVLVELNCPIRLAAGCAACLRRFELELPIGFQLTLKPAGASGRQLPGEQELSAADLNEACYAGGLIELDELLREQIILGLPMHPKCRPHCRGLCQACGNDLNLADCDCQSAEIDPRLAVLKAFKAP